MTITKAAEADKLFIIIPGAAGGHGAGKHHHAAFLGMLTDDFRHLRQFFRRKQSITICQ